jgi:hypothetical protein
MLSLYSTKIKGLNEGKKNHALIVLYDLTLYLLVQQNIENSFSVN